MATIARLVVEISAKTADFHQAMDAVNRTTRDSVRQMEASASAVRALESRFQSLRTAFRTSQISEQDFANAMKTLKADVAELAQQGNLAQGSLDRLARVGQNATRELRNVSAQARRSAEGIEAFGVASLAASELAVGGMAGIGRAASALGVFVRTNPLMIGILAGLTALSAAWELLTNKTDEATEATNRYLGQSRELLQKRLALVLAEQAALPAARAAQTVQDPMGGFHTIPGFDPNGELRARLTLQESLIRGALMQADAQTQVTRQLRAQVDLTERLMTREALHGAKFNRPTGIGQTADFLRFIEGGKGSDPAKAVEDSLGPALQQYKDFGKQVMNVSDTIVSGLVSVAQSIGQGFKGIGAAILGVVGGFMVSLGKSMIATAIAVKALRSIITNPVAAAVAGAALVVLGSALAASANRSARSTFGGGGGGGGGGGSSYSSGGGGGGGGTQVIYLVGNKSDTYTWQQVDQVAQIIGDGQRRRIIPAWRDA